MKPDIFDEFDKKFAYDRLGSLKLDIARKDIKDWIKANFIEKRKLKLTCDAIISEAMALHNKELREKLKGWYGTGGSQQDGYNEALIDVLALL